MPSSRLAYAASYAGWHNSPDTTSSTSLDELPDVSPIGDTPVFLPHASHARPSARPPAIGADEDAAALPANPRWSDLYSLYRGKRLVERGRPARELEAVDDTDRLFRQAVGDPLLADLSEETLLCFKGWLSRRVWRGKPIAPRTIVKHLSHLGPILAYAGPRQGRGMRAKRTAARRGLFGIDPETGTQRMPPAMCGDDWPDVTNKKKPALRVRQIEEWIDAVAGAQKPMGGHPLGFWNACLVVWCRNTAMRIESTIAAEWSWLDGHWLTIPPSAIKGKKTELKIYVNSWALGAARAIRTKNPRIFSWDFTECYLLSVLRKAAPNPLWRTHRLRSTFATELVGKKLEIVARCQLGHKGGVTQEHYTEYEKVAPEVLEDPKVLPQPRPRLVKLPERVRLRDDVDDVDDGLQRRLFY